MHHCDSILHLMGVARRSSGKARRSDGGDRQSAGSFRLFEQGQ
jgi:hypothetical protein